jgi:hypothetical protein
VIRIIHDITQDLDDGLAKASLASVELTTAFLSLDRSIGLETDELEDLVLRVERMRKALDVLLKVPLETALSSLGRNHLEAEVVARRDAHFKALEILNGRPL